MKTNINVNCYIKLSELINLSVLDSFSLENFNDKGVEDLLSTYPVTIYREKMVGNSFVSVSIPLNLFMLFVAYKKVK